MNQLDPYYPPIELPIQRQRTGRFKRIATQHASSLQNGFLVSDWSQPGHHTYWVNPRIVGEQLAEVTRIEGAKWPNQFMALVKFLDRTITNFKSRILFIGPKEGIAQTEFKKLPTESIYDRDKVNQEVKTIDFARQHIPNCYDEKLIQIARWKILQESLAQANP